MRKRVFCERYWCNCILAIVFWIPMDTNCAPLIADIFFFCYKRDFMMSLSDDKQAGIIDAFRIKKGGKD